MNNAKLTDTQRMWDLLRYQRHDLFVDDLITEEEFTQLAMDHPAVARLESYDALRQQLTRLRDALKEVHTKLLDNSDSESLVESIRMTLALESSRPMENNL